MNWLSNRKADKTFRRPYKIVFFGDYSVGKTSIVRRFHRQDINTESTVGCSFTIYKHQPGKENEKPLILNFWDTAGQERYRTMTRVYFYDCQCAIVVYDMTREESLETVLQYWLPEFLKHENPHCVIYLVGNKADLYYDNFSSVNDQHRRKLLNDAKSLHSDIRFYEVSALTQENIRSLLSDICVKAEQWYEGDRSYGAKKDDVVDINQMIADRNERRRGKCCT